MAHLQQEKRGNFYRITVKGVLDSQWADWFYGLTIRPVGDDKTALEGQVNDQSALHGLLAKIRDLGLTLLLVQMVEGEQIMNEYQFTLHLGATPQDIVSTTKDELVLVEGLGQNIIHHLGNVELGKSIKIFLRDKENKVVGGISGSLFGGWVYISLLWVEESLRNLGYGRELLSRLEKEAIQLGCQYAHVDTYSFEAKPFYERAGYKVFAKLDDYPAGHSKHFLKKTLVVDERIVIEMEEPK